MVCCPLVWVTSCSQNLDQLFLSQNLANNALQVGRFRYVQQDRMVERLAALFQNSHSAARIGSGGAEHREEFRLADMERTGAGDENAAWPKHLQGAKIQLLIAAQRGRHGALGLGERRWIENDGVILPARDSVVLEQVEGVGFYPFDLAATVSGPVELLVLLRHFQYRTRRVHGGDGRACGREVQRKSSLIGEAVERVSVSVP